jgi:hypothetical protein
MTITQTVEIPASRRLTIDVPQEVPAGRVVITFTPMAETNGIADASSEEVVAVGEKILKKHLAAFKALAQ